MGAKPQPLAERLANESDLSVRSALILSLGNFPLLDHSTLLPQMQEIYDSADDPGLHAAAEWLLQQWQQDDVADDRPSTAPPRKEQREKRLAKDFPELESGDAKSRQWFVNSQAKRWS